MTDGKGSTKHRVMSTILSTTWWHSTNELITPRCVVSLYIGRVP